MVHMTVTTEPMCCEKCGRPFETRDRHGIHFEGYTPFLNGEAVPLPLTAGSLFKVLVERFGNFVHKDRLFHKIWGGHDTETDPKVLDVYICKLRKKLVGTPYEIRTSWGLGYGIFFRGQGVGSCEPVSTNPTQERVA